ncbi:MAG: hypothetical protein ABIR71_14420 [Chthoniobacterales bacterium]
MIRILLAAVLGAIAMFFWSFIAHTFLPLGEAGIGEIPNEKAVVAAMQSEMGDKPGLYYFPGTGLGPDATRAQKEEAMKRIDAAYASNPSGFLMYHPPGQPFNFGKRLTIEFATELAQCLLAVFLLAQTRLASFVARWGFVTLLGVLAAVATNISYWNWYGFPTIYTAAYICMQLVGYICAGLVIALVWKKRATS